MNTFLRSARPDDVDRIIDIENTASVVYRGLEGYAWVHELPAMTPSQVAASIAEDGLWVVEIDGAVVGYGLTYRHGDDCHLRELNVLPDHARRGLGRMIVEHIAEVAKRRGCRRVVLTTFLDVPFNAPWYAHLGFVALDEATLDGWVADERAEERREGLDAKPRQAMALML